MLVRAETSPEDVDGMHRAVGILTSTGGKTSHAAVVAVGWGKCCVVGAGAISIDAKKGTMHVAGKTFGRDDVLSIDGSSGEVMVGAVKATIPKKMSKEFLTLMEWANKYASMKVRTNADSPEDARRAREFGAVGIGLCRTEHMFFGGERIQAIREMILSEDIAAREKLPGDYVEQILLRLRRAGIVQSTRGARALSGWLVAERGPVPWGGGGGGRAG